VEQSRLHVLEPTFFANGAEVGGVRERALGSPNHPLAHRGAWRRRAGRGSSAPPLLWPLASTQFPGVWGARARARWTSGPSPFASAIKCHQKSTCNSAGSSVGSLAPPRATPRLGGAGGRVVPVLPLLLCTRPARARPSVGGQSPPPAPR
jgi:hypothetical protein